MRHRQGIIGYRQQPTARKPPGRLEQAARRKARAARPYLIAVAAAEALAVIAAAWLGFPLAAGSLLGLGLGLGAAGHHAFSRLWEAVDIRRNGGKRAARQRRKVQGMATWLERHRYLSLRAARKRAKVTRPQTPGRLPAHEAGVHIGKAGGRRIAVSHEDAVTVIGPPRSGKSAAVGNWIWDAPGAVLVTSTRPDLYTNTAVPRRGRGPVWTLNPGRDGGIPTTFHWSPLDGCEDPDEAIAAAATIMAAAPQDAVKDAYWTEGAADVLGLLMHAAILGGYSIDDVRGWVSDVNAAAEHALPVLDNHPMATGGWGDALAGFLISEDSPEKVSIMKSAESGLRWLNSPAMSKIATAPPDQWLDVEQFIEDGDGTVYLIGANKSLAPFVAAFTGRLFRAAKRIASVSPGHRLDPPLTLALDEAAIICPVPLQDWSSEAGGHGITLLAAVQSPSQLKARWGEHGADTIWNNTSKLIFGGLSLAKDLDDISKACGEHDTWEWVKDPGTGKKRRQPSAPRPTVLPERIRKMAPGTALFLHRGVRPFFTHLKPVWERSGYTPAAAPSAVTAPLLPLDGTVMPAVPGHLSGPMYAATAPARAVAAPSIHPALEEVPDGQDR